MSHEASTAEQRIACVDEQIDAIQRGLRDTIGCPYCGKLNRREAVCCLLLAKAIEAVLEARELAGRLALADQIFNRIN
jgi:hypothetical protein